MHPITIARHVLQNENYLIIHLLFIKEIYFLKRS